MNFPDLQSMSIVLFPDPVLKRRCEPMGEIDDAVRALASRMLELMHEAKGVGLAAPQVGVSSRLFVCNPTGEPEDDLVCVNPTITNLSGGEEKEEGCLSIPNVTVMMRRATQGALQASDLDGHTFQRLGSDLEVRIWQHEIAHLDGRLIITNMSATDEIANRKALKQLEADYA